MGNFLGKFPEKKALLECYNNSVSKIDNTGSNGKLTAGKGKIPAVDGHIHSPYSFSAFNDLEQAYRMASDEGVKVLGINDFNTTKGNDLFHDLSLQYKVFPLFNIEFMGLLTGEQKKGIRINDPNNPERIYFSGKGLDYPVSWKEGSKQKVRRIIDESHRQVKAMTDKLNGLVQKLDPAMHLDFNDIEKRYTRRMVRERHIARAFRELLFERLKTEGAIRAFLNQLYGNTGSGADINDSAALENEIRGRLLKAGGMFVIN